MQGFDLLTSSFDDSRFYGATVLSDPNGKLYAQLEYMIVMSWFLNIIQTVLVLQVLQHGGLTPETTTDLPANSRSTSVYFPLTFHCSQCSRITCNFICTDAGVLVFTTSCLMRVSVRPPPPSKASSDELICTPTARGALSDGEHNDEDIPRVILEGRTWSAGPYPQSPSPPC